MSPDFIQPLPETTNSRRPAQAERGSVIFYILIAIVLFAALSMAISRSGRESTASIDTEKNDLSTTEVFDFANALRGSIENMLTQGIKQNQICFDTPVYSAGTFNYSACTTAANQVFGTGGGNAPAPREVSANVLDQSKTSVANYGVWYFPSTIHVKGVGDDCDPSPDCNELITILQPISNAVCININEKLNNPNASTIPVNSTQITLQPYLGSFAFVSAIDATDLNGKRTGCVQEPDGTNIFYAVLVAN